MDPGPACRHRRPGRCAAGERRRRQRQDRRADGAGRPAHHRPGTSRGRRPAPHRHLHQRRRRRAPRPHRAGAAPPQSGRAGQHGSPPPADAFAESPHLHHRRLLPRPAPQALSGAGHPAGLHPCRPRQRGDAAERGPLRDAGSGLSGCGLLRLRRPLRQGPHRQGGGGGCFAGL